MQVTSDVLELKLPTKTSNQNENDIRKFSVEDNSYDDEPLDLKLNDPQSVDVKNSLPETAQELVFQEPSISVGKEEVKTIDMMSKFLSLNSTSQTINQELGMSILSNASEVVAESKTVGTTSLNATNNIWLSSINSVFVEVSPSNAGMNIISRMFPVGGIANGYLSLQYIQPAPYQVDELGENQFFKTITTEITQKPQEIRTNNSSNTDIGAHQKNGAFSFITNTSKNSHYEKSEELSRLQSTSAFLDVDYAKRNLLITPNAYGSTVFYRDYEIDESLLNRMKDRLAKSEFVRSNNIQEIYVNGELLWKKEEGETND